MFHLKGFRRGKASPVPSRHGKRQVQPAPAVQRPDLTALYAAEFPYQPTTIEFLRNRATNLRAVADDLDTHARDDIAWAAHHRGEAADLDRMAAVAEQERETPAEAFSAWSCPCGCSPISCLYCDAECACGADCPNCKHLVKLGAGPAHSERQTPAAGYFVHWLSGHDFWPACGEQGFGAKWATPHAAAVTCPTCQEAAEGERVLPTEPWTSTSEADAAGWNDPLPGSVTDTAVLEAVDGGAR